MNLDIIKGLCKDETIEMTAHVWNRCQQRNISYKQIKEAIMASEIVEEYPDDYPYPSCLLLGATKENVNLHVVVGIGRKKLWIITAYIPDEDKWTNGYRTRKEAENE